MRLIVTLPDQHDAATFVDYLTTLNVSARAERSGEQWDLWILDEDRVGEAKTELTSFLANRGDDKYRAAVRAADAMRRERVEKALEARRKQLPMAGAALSRGRRPLTMLLLFASAAVFVMSEFGTKPVPIRKLFVTERTYLTQVAGIPTYDLPEVRRGEVWRIVSPILIHFTILHFVFNMFMLVEMGSVIEGRRGTLVMAGLVLSTAIVGNLAQVVWSAVVATLISPDEATLGPFFGGMSGVVYGLFGYILVKARYNAEQGFSVAPTTILILGAWLLICMTGYVGRVANAAHLGGLIAGAAFAYVPVVVRSVRGKP